ncbi:hypothetical protein MTR_3g035450 [Medicago truncatula]|uniref:Uncharacterized protein n=1 Tax=Medicago truncatula TaxID=3880 RepID=G7J0Y6_MEDTR|nr:hypothetical protein MTR_3g035450 [Medicago truncatula]
MGDLPGSFPVSVRVRTKHAEKTRVDLWGQSTIPLPVRCRSGTNQAEAGGHVTPKADEGGECRRCTRHDNERLSTASRGTESRLGRTKESKGINKKRNLKHLKKSASEVESASEAKMHLMTSSKVSLSEASPSEANLIRSCISPETEVDQKMQPEVSNSCLLDSTSSKKAKD